MGLNLYRRIRLDTLYPLYHCIGVSSYIRCIAVSVYLAISAVSLYDAISAVSTYHVVSAVSAKYDTMIVKLRTTGPLCLVPIGCNNRTLPDDELSSPQLV